MAFTELTFSHLRESVKQSMAEDKKKGLPTGEILSTKTPKVDLQNKLVNVLYAYTPLGFNKAYEFLDEHETRITNPILKNGSVFCDVQHKVNDKQVKKSGIKLGRALKLIYPDLSDEAVKQTVTDVTTQLEPVYVLFTDRDIHTHYRVLAIKQSLNSCMSKEPGYYENIRPDTSTDDPKWVRYIYPTEPYNGSPNLRLALMSRYHPDSPEYNKSDQYPFIGRAIVLIDGEDLRFARAYGIENARERFISAGLDDSSTNGGKLNIIYNANTEIVAPYVDPHNSIQYEEGDEYLVIDADGNYEIEYSEAVLREKQRNYCDHCGEYHSDCHEDDYITLYNDDTVYGDCRDNYAQAYHNDEFYPLDDLTWSDYHDAYILNNRAICFISEIDRRGNAETDYVDMDSENEILQLSESYQYENYADSSLCIETENGDIYLADWQNNYYFYCDIDNKYYSRDGSEVWSETLDTYLPEHLAVAYGDDWVTQEYLDELNEGEQHAA